MKRAMRNLMKQYSSRNRRGRLAGRSRARILAISLVIFWLGWAVPLFAQEYQAGLDFTVVIPQDDFRQSLSATGYGASGFFAARLKSSPLLVGIEAGGVTYGSVSRKEPLSPTIPNVRVNVVTDNNIVLTHVLLRAQPREGRVRPYADGLVGFKYLFTTTSIRDDFDDEELASNKDFSDTTLSYGFGGGVQIQLNQGTRPKIWLDSKVRYLRGGRANYLKEGSIRQENGRVVFDVLSSRTDVITAQVGITFSF